MNREILFRGKREDSGEWVYGSYCEYKICKAGGKLKQCYSVQTVKENGVINKIYDVKKETVGQFTGLLDKNGKRIFEGDVVETRQCYSDIPLKYEVCFGKYEQDGSADEYSRTDCLGFYGNFISLEAPEWDLEYEIADYLKQFSIIDSEFSGIEIIGNIHEEN